MHKGSLQKVDYLKFEMFTGFNPDVALTCRYGSTLCHSRATCISDTFSGFCCRCERGFFGDGKACLPDGLPQRINGKVSGKINSATFTDQVH